MSDAATKSAATTEFTLSRWRFVVVTGVFFVGFAANLSFAIYGAVTPSAAERYGVSQAVINNLTLYYTALFLVFSYPCMWLLNNKGLRVSMMVTASVSIIGCLIRWLSFAVSDQTGQVVLLHVGHIILGAACPFTISAPTITAAAWFSGDGRLLANTVMTLAAPLSAALATGIAPLIVTDDLSSIDSLNMYAFIAAVVLGLPAFLIYDKPPTPPSRSEAQKNQMTLKESLMQISGNRYFWILTTVFAVVTAVLNVTSTIISSMVVPYGYTEDDSGNIAVAAIASGLVGAILIGAILDRTKKHRLGIKIMAFLAFVGFTLFTVAAMNPDLSVMAYVGAAIFGFGGLPSMALSMELGVECSYPIGENVSTGIQWCATQFFSMLLIIISNYARNSDGQMGVLLIVISACLFVVFLVSLLFNPRNRRMALEGVQTEVREEEVEMTTTEQEKA
ncbi:Major facilitator super domain-containing protein 7 [Entophlyctis luteolus]|nr:Major facilitator super domain-containing protein 7 [Entophlyctis luteolus]